MNQQTVRTFIIGDIHGCFDELQQLITKIELKPEDLLISLGDLVDRGNKSKEVYHYFSKRPNTVVLVGNHERKHQNGVLSYAQEIVKIQFGAEYESFLTWIQTLPYYYETEEAIIVHAAFEEGVALKDQKQEVLSGATSGERYLEKKYAPETYWTEYYTGEKPIIYGHHVVGDSPKIFNNTYGIDTGACHGGYLTAIELPDFIIHQVKVEKDHWKEEQATWQIPVLRSKDWNNMEILAIKKQLEKLNYIEEPAVKEYLHTLHQWVFELEELQRTLKEKIDTFTQKLVEEHGANFSVEANKLFFKTFLFKSKAGNLSVADISRSLNTPAKVMELKDALEINK